MYPYANSLPVLQMYAMPVFDMAEDFCRRKNIRSKLITRVFVRTVFVVFTAFVGISLPFFGGESYLSYPSILGTGIAPISLPACLPDCLSVSMQLCGSFCL